MRVGLVALEGSLQQDEVPNPSRHSPLLYDLSLLRSWNSLTFNPRVKSTCHQCLSSFIGTWPCTLTCVLSRATETTGPSEPKISTTLALYTHSLLTSGLTSKFLALAPVGSAWTHCFPPLHLSAQPLTPLAHLPPIPFIDSVHSFTALAYLQHSFAHSFLHSVYHFNTCFPRLPVC